MAICSLLAACGPGEVSRTELLQSVREQQVAGDFQGTVEPLKRHLAAHPDDGEVNYLYGKALSRTRPHLAVFSLRKAGEDPAWFVPAGLQLAVVALAAQDFDEAVRITTEILEREPTSLRALMMRANAYAHSKTAPELAVADARRMLAIDAGALEAYEPLILGLLALDRLEEAHAALEEVGDSQKEWQTDPAQLSWHCVTTALFERERGQLEQARETLAMCLSANPGNRDVVASAAQFFDSQGEPERSVEILREALAAVPRSRPFRLELAQRLAASGQGAAADALLMEGTEFVEPQAAAAGWLDLGKFRQALRDYGPAADALEQAVEVLPGDDPAAGLVQFELADALVLADRLDRALAVADDLPLAAHRHLIRGRVRQEQRRPAEALAEFDQAILLWPDNPWGRYYAGLAAEELGDFGRALIEFRNSVRINPAATDARTRGAALLLADGRPGAARIMLLTEVAKAPLRIEGLILLMKVAGLQNDAEGMLEFLGKVTSLDPGRVGEALAQASAGLARLAGPALAVDMLAKAPVELGDPTYVAALRAFVRHAHAAGEAEARRPALADLLDGQPASSAFADVRALELELSGAPAEDVREAYARALALDSNNPDAHTGTGRAMLDAEPSQALVHFDRAAALDPSNPEPKLAAARVCLEVQQAEQAAERLDALLVEHPYEAEAAYESALLALEREGASDRVLERARRAVRFGGSDQARELLARVRALRETPAS